VKSHLTLKLIAPFIQTLFVVHCSDHHFHRIIMIQWFNEWLSFSLYWSPFSLSERVPLNFLVKRWVAFLRVNFTYLLFLKKSFLLFNASWHPQYLYRLVLYRCCFLRNLILFETSMFNKLLFVNQATDYPNNSIALEPCGSEPANTNAPLSKRP
jgi:hypothetical protein